MKLLKKKKLRIFCETKMIDCEINANFSSGDTEN